jgi:flagellar hook protein FlgE
MNEPDNRGIEDPTDTVARPGYITTIPVKVFDEQGGTHTVTAHFTRTQLDNAVDPPISTWRVQLLGEDDGDPLTPLPTVGAPVDVQFQNGKPVIDNTGTEGDPLNVLRSITVGTAPTSYTVDLTDVTAYSGTSDARVFDTDGQTAGALTSLSYTVSDSGEIIGVYSNGLKQTLGQVAMATFKNVNGLEKVGNSMYRTTVNSGYAQVGEPGSAGMGQVISGALEMSNVDLAQEFTNLVVAQRGFQANSRIITTSDEILQELVSMKR